MRLQVSFYLLNKLCFPVIRMVFPAFEAFQGRLTKNLQEMNNPEVQTPRPKHRAGTEKPRWAEREKGGHGGHPRVGCHSPARACARLDTPPPPSPSLPASVPQGAGVSEVSGQTLCSC